MFAVRGLPLLPNQVVLSSDVDVPQALPFTSLFSPPMTPVNDGSSSVE
jgi:hypothetical protein